ncbi:MAG: methylisocitrate lyase [Pirellulaceae bacterium]|nr:methylisocitrate lyase [Pirellulaceae bacterium]
MNDPSPGARFRLAMQSERPLQIVGAVNALCAMQAERAGFRALYLSGAGVANASHGLPDLGVTSMNDVVLDAARITAASSLPLLVDIDTGWGTELTIQRAIREFERIGAAGVHLEDQVADKRCGHRPGKQLVETGEMCARIEAAISSRLDNSFVIMARTDAASVEGIEAAIGRAQAYVASGADMIFAEAIESLDDYRRFVDAVSVSVLANLTEFGRTPSFSLDELNSVGVRMALYPLTAFRAMNAAAKATYEVIRQKGSQRSILDRLQTREQLYEILNYHVAERKIDQQKIQP